MNQLRDNERPKTGDQISVTSLTRIVVVVATVLGLGGGGGGLAVSMSLQEKVSTLETKVAVLESTLGTLGLRLERIENKIDDMRDRLPRRAKGE